MRIRITTPLQRQTFRLTLRENYEEWRVAALNKLAYFMTSPCLFAPAFCKEMPREVILEGTYKLTECVAGLFSCVSKMSHKVRKSPSCPAILPCVVDTRGPWTPSLFCAGLISQQSWKKKCYLEPVTGGVWVIQFWLGGAWHSSLSSVLCLFFWFPRCPRTCGRDPHLGEF